MYFIMILSFVKGLYMRTIAPFPVCIYLIFINCLSFIYPCVINALIIPVYKANAFHQKNKEGSKY